MASITQINVNGTTYDIKAGIIGIDTSNLIASSSSPYTATEDCIACVFITTSNGTVKPTLNNVEIGQFYSQGTVYHAFTMPLKKGQVLANFSTVKVFGAL